MNIYAPSLYLEISITDMSSYILCFSLFLLSTWSGWGSLNPVTRQLKYATTRPTKQRSKTPARTKVLAVPKFCWSLPPMRAPSDCPRPPYIAFKNINCGDLFREEESDEVRSIQHTKMNVSKCCISHNTFPHLPSSRAYHEAQCDVRRQCQYSRMHQKSSLAKPLQVGHGRGASWQHK